MITALRTQFLTFHRKNPQVYRQIKDMCQALWDRGWRHYGMHTVMHALRYRMDLETGGDDVQIAGGEIVKVKLNNNHSAYYARLLAYKVQRFEHFFEYRRVQGEQDGEVILFSDIPGEADFVLGHRPPKRRRLRRPSTRRKR